MQGLHKTKHIGIRYHEVRDAIEAGTVYISRTPPEMNKAEGVTKVLVKDNLQKPRSDLSCV